MGRRTAETITSPLKNRLNLILSRTGLQLQDAIKQCNQDPSIESIFIIGGKEIYELAIDKLMISHIYLTTIEKSYKCDKLMTDLTDLSLSIIVDEYKFKIEDTVVRFKHTVSMSIEYNVMDNKRHAEYKYQQLLYQILQENALRDTRNAPVYSSFGHKLEFDLSDSFPLFTTRKVFFKGIFEELMFFLRGQTDTKILADKNVHIWDANTSAEFLAKMKLDYQPGDLVHVLAAISLAFQC